jgi:hypothetical protein
VSGNNSEGSVTVTSEAGADMAHASPRFINIRKKTRRPQHEHPIWWPQAAMPPRLWCDAHRTDADPGRPMVHVAGTAGPDVITGS